MASPRTLSSRDVSVNYIEFAAILSESDFKQDLNCPGLALLPPLQANRASLTVLTAIRPGLHQVRILPVKLAIVEAQ